MVVIAVMPAAGLMISIGNSIPMINHNSAFLASLGNIIAQIGWAIIVNLHLLFALAIGGSWAKERAGGAFASGLGLTTILAMTFTMKAWQSYQNNLFMFQIFSCRRWMMKQTTILDARSLPKPS